MIIGIDPGKTGGFACLTADRKVRLAIAMPESMQELFDEIESLLFHDEAFAFVEKAQAMPKNGAVSMFNYGVGYGQILGILTALKIPHELVSPANWSKFMLSGAQKKKGDKTRNIEAARRLFPDVQALRKGKGHSGIADALLIASYGHTQILGNAG